MRAWHRDTATGKLIRRAGGVSVDCCDCACTCTGPGCVSQFAEFSSCNCHGEFGSPLCSSAPETCCCGPCAGRRYRYKHHVHMRFVSHPAPGVLIFCERTNDAAGDGFFHVNEGGLCVGPVTANVVEAGDPGVCGPFSASYDYEIGSFCGPPGEAPPTVWGPPYEGGCFDTAGGDVTQAGFARQEGCHRWSDRYVVSIEFGTGGYWVTPALYYLESSRTLDVDNDAAECQSGTVGACCYADRCVDCSTEAECIASGGTFAGAGVSCFDAPDCPPRWRCCSFGGGCVELTEADCDEIEGEWFEGVTCADDPPCPVQGACCAGNGSGECAELTEEECADAGGIFRPSIMCSLVNCKLYYRTKLCDCNGTVEGWQPPVVDPECWEAARAGGLYCPVWRVPHAGGFVCVEAIPEEPFAFAGPTTVILCEGSDPWGCCGCCESCESVDFTVYRDDYHLGVATRTNGLDTKCCCDPDTASTDWYELREIFSRDGGGVLHITDRVEITGTVTAASPTVHVVHTDFGFTPPQVDEHDTTVALCGLPPTTLTGAEGGISEGTLTATCAFLNASGYTDNTGSGGLRTEFTVRITRSPGDTDCASCDFPLPEEDSPPSSPSAPLPTSAPARPTATPRAPSGKVSTAKAPKRAGCGNTGLPSPAEIDAL